MQLRPYQEKALARFARSEHKSCLIVAPTGAGKGTMATELLTRAAREKRRALFLVHRREIVNDIVERLAQRRVKTAQTLYSDRYVRVASVQSLLRADIRPVDLLIVDEAHHYAADEWQEVVARIKCHRICGFTATPQRADGRPLGDMFTDIIDTVSYSTLTKMGLLVPARVLRPGAKLGNDLARDPVESYLRFARGDQALIFVRRVADAEAVRDRLRAAGIAAESVHAKTPVAVRDQTMERLEAGELRAVVNVGTLTEGVDVPHVTTCVLARPCAHASTYVQIVGRVLRAAPGKKLATVIDLVGASHVHGLPGADLAYSLEGDGLHVRSEVDRDSRSGPSGPHRDQEILDLELECVHTYPVAVPVSPGAKLDEVKPGNARAYRERGGPLSGLVRKGTWWYYRRRIKERGTSTSYALHTQDEVEAQRLAELARAGEWSAFALLRAEFEELAGTAKYAPKDRPAPAACTPGSLFQDKGFWFAQWSEHGKKHRMGLGTKDRAVAEASLEVLRAQGSQAMRDEVRMRKRDAASIYRKQGKSKGPGLYYMKAWNRDKTELVTFALGTRDKAEAERMRDLYAAGRFAEFDKLALRGFEEVKKEAQRARRAAARARHAAAKHPPARAHAPAPP